MKIWSIKNCFWLGNVASIYPLNLYLDKIKMSSQAVTVWTQTFLATTANWAKHIQSWHKLFTLGSKWQLNVETKTPNNREYRLWELAGQKNFDPNCCFSSSFSHTNYFQPLWFPLLSLHIYLHFPLNISPPLLFVPHFPGCCVYWFSGGPLFRWRGGEQWRTIECGSFGRIFILLFFLLHISLLLFPSPSLSAAAAASAASSLPDSCYTRHLWVFTPRQRAHPAARPTLPHVLLLLKLSSTSPTPIGSPPAGGRGGGYRGSGGVSHHLQRTGWKRWHHSGGR